MIKVLLVDDQKLIRDGIKSLLTLSGCIDVVGECADGGEVIDQVQTVQPEVILLDLSMPKVDGIATLTLLNQAGIVIPVIILTTFDDHDAVLQSIQLGAKGFLLKDVSLETLTDSIQQVAQGKTVLQPAVTERLLSRLDHKVSGDASLASHTMHEKLTEKELEILQLIAGGFSNKEIAHALNKSEGTIKNQVSSVLAKLDSRDRTRAVLKALELGLLTSNQSD